jgi:hypothetical protein
LQLGALGIDAAVLDGVEARLRRAHARLGLIDRGLELRLLGRAAAAKIAKK